MQTINLNNQVTVNLTPYGKSVYQSYHKAITKRELTQDLDIPVKFSLWEFCQIFGPYLYNGNPQIITVDNQITID